MITGIGSYTYTWGIGVPGYIPDNPITPLKLIDKAVEAGLQVVQFADNIPLHLISKNELDKLAAYSQSCGIGIEVGSRGLVTEDVLNYLKIASILNSPILRIVIDRVNYAPSLDKIKGVIEEIEPHLKEQGVILAIENHDRLKARDFANIVEHKGSEWIGICLDSVNSLGAAEGLETVVDTLAPYTVNLHVKEFTIRRLSHQMGFQVEGVPLGQGMLPLDWMLSKLGSRCQSAILEQWVPPEQTLPETILKEERWAQDSIRYLKQHVH